MSGDPILEAKEHPCVDVESVNTIVDECIAKSRIRYEYGDGFFLPKLKGINYLEVGRSKIVSSPVTIVLELLYLLYKRVRNRWRSFLQGLFPREPKVWGRTHDSRLVGRLVCPDRFCGQAPMHNVRVEFWGRTRWLAWRKYAEGLTDAEGCFDLPFDLRVARRFSTRSLQLDVYRIAGIRFEDGRPVPRYEVFRSIAVPKGDLIGMRYNLRTNVIPLWEYRRDVDYPRTLIPEDAAQAPETYVKGRTDAMMQQIIPIELTKLKHLEQIEHDPGSLTIAQIQADYPISLVAMIEERLPGYTRGDAWFGRRMMNGMNRGYFMPDPHETGRYWIKYFGICGYDRNDEYALPSAAIKFLLDPKGLPIPVEIHLTGQVNAFDKDPFQRRIVRPEHGDDWLYAKRIARCTGAFCTEVDEHFAGTHANTEQYAIAANRNLRLNPIAGLLLPHLKEVALINHAADKLLLDGYIPSATAATRAGLSQRIRDMVGLQDWKNWRPMEPVSPAHACAAGEVLFWEVVGEYVEGFCRENEKEIKAQWLEIHRFSEDLVRHSVPVFLSDRDVERWTPEERRLAEERIEYGALQYRFDLNVPRERIDGELKAVSPITKARSFDESAPGDWQSLIDVCRYIVMTATYLHTWINEMQYDDLSEVLYCCGGLRFGEKERGVFAPESDHSIAPDLTRCTQMVFIISILSRTEYGFITRNEDGDVSPAFSRLLEERREAFRALGIDVDAIESRTNI